MIVLGRSIELPANLGSLTMDLKRFQFWNSQVIPWITLLAIGAYMGMSARVVLGGGTSLGSFLATINVYKEPVASLDNLSRGWPQKTSISNLFLAATGPGRQILHNLARLCSSQQGNLTPVCPNRPAELRDRVASEEYKLQAARIVAWQQYMCSRKASFL